MAIRIFLITLLAAFPLMQVFAQNDNSYVKVHSAYNAQWNRYEKLGQDGLPNEQVALLDSIIQVSLQQKNAPEFHRALSVYAFAIRESMKESTLKHEKLANLEMLAESIEPPYSNILHSFLADQYQRYTSNWNLSSWGEDFSVACLIDGKTVYFTKDQDRQELIIDHHYRKSIENLELLLQQKSMNYANSLPADSTYFLKNPTLANAIAYKFLNHFTSKSKPEFDPQWYAGSEAFQEKSPMEILKLYQKLELFHWRKLQIDAYTHWTLFRLDFVQRAEKNKDKPSELYLEALQQLKAQLSGHPSTLGVVLSEMRLKLNDPANQYDWKSKPDAVNKQREIHSLAVESLKMYPTSTYAKEIKTLIDNIESAYVRITFATTYALGKPNLMTVNYKNVQNAFLTIYHIDEKPATQEWAANPLSNYKLSKVHDQPLVLDEAGKYN